MPFRTRTDGYERVRDYDPVEKRERYAYIHQLVAIANGADPEKVFSGGEYVIHHVDGIKWHNVPENLQLSRSNEHTRHHNTAESGEVGRV